MCGIVGYIGHEQAAPILLDGLERLEYRGYDSAGIAVLSPEQGLQVKKAKGRLKVLKALVDDGKAVEEDMSAIAGRDDNGLIMEHADFLTGILTGQLLNEGEQVAMSTATTIMGTLAAYSGRQVKMNDLLANEKSEFYNGHNSAFLAKDFEGAADIALPPEGHPPVPGKEELKG